MTEIKRLQCKLPVLNKKSAIRPLRKGVVSKLNQQGVWIFNLCLNMQRIK